MNRVERDDRLHLEHAGACRTTFRGVPEACARVLLVGEDNPISAAPEHALFCAPEGCAGQRLQELIFGLPKTQYLALWRTNLCIGGWSVRRARARAGNLTEPGAPWSLIVMLGRKVAAAFSQALPVEVPPFQRCTRAATVTSGSRPCPTPPGATQSGTNAGRSRCARRLMTELVPELAWGAA